MDEMFVRLRNPYVFSCRIKERMLLCLKYVGSISRAKTSGSLMTNESPLRVHCMQCSVVWAETI